MVCLKLIGVFKMTLSNLCELNKATKDIYIFRTLIYLNFIMILLTQITRVLSRDLPQET